MRKLLAITGALADESRIRAFLALARGPLCVCQIVELLQLAPSTVSKHLSVLRQAGLVEARKEGRWMYYSLPGDADLLTRETLAWIENSAVRDPGIAKDARRLEAILKEDPEELCRRQMAKSQSCSSAPATHAEARWRKGGRAGSKAKR
jgi:ArsR family transcriptional regulator